MSSKFTAFFVTFFILFGFVSLAQYTDRPVYSSDYTPNDNPPPAIVVTSPDGYDNFNLGTDFAEPHMMANPMVPTQFFNAFNTNGAHYTLNGYDWVNTTPVFGVSVNGDPVIAWDSLGTLYYENMYGGVTGCRVVRSTDGGVTFNTAVIAIAGNDKNWIAADQSAGPYSNYVYTVMTPGNFARSTNQGVSFTTTTTLTPQSLPGMMVAVGPNLVGGDIPGGCVYVVTHSGSNSAGVYNFFVSTNGGVSFTSKGAQSFSGYIGSEVSGRSQVQNMRTRPYPLICADNSYGPNRGRLYLVYASNNPAGNGNKSDIFLRYSDNQGTTWSAAKVVNDDVNSNLNFQWMPSYWVDKTTGNLYLQWMDTRDTPTSDSCHIYGTVSMDGGLTFLPNKPITTTKFKINCSTCGGSGTPRYQGDYTAMVSNGKVGMAVWHDYRAGTFGSYTGYLPDFAFLSRANSLTVYQNNNTSVWLAIPSVKLYTDTVLVSATVTPAPTAGSITFSFTKPAITAYPDSTMMTISAALGTTPGNYTVIVTAKGPNGTPVHRRNINLTVNNDVPVELVSFTSSAKDGAVNLSWITATETNNRGFEVMRSLTSGTSRTPWQIIGFVKGNGTSVEDNNYSFRDNNISQTGKYYYKLKQLDFNGNFEYSPEVEVDINRPVAFILDQNYPNPFNPATSIKYALPVESNVRLTILNSLGQEIDVLVNQVQAGAIHNVNWNSAGYSSGVYLYRIEAQPVDGSKGFIAVRKMMLLK